ncbi:MAG TPA: YdjY domain-containing protein [Thermoanaerobaculia bacterium]|nr:YdjY domain-containing protein [Thermoanaerobaculia bacterium]
MKVGRLVAALLAAGCAAEAGSETAAGRVTVDRAARAVSLPATVHREAFHRRVLGMPGYHLVVWRGGSAAPAALFRAGVTDVQVLEGLESLGAKPGNALEMETWDEREDRRSRAPERVIAGPPVEVLVRVPGRKKPLGLAEVLEDPGRRGFAMRFGGHRANIPEWHSGCVVCLYSCPGSKVGNAAYTVRDWVEGTTRFRVRRGALPPDGTAVTIVLRLLPEEPGF